MSLIIDKLKTVAITGHRKINSDINFEKLNIVFYNLVNNGYNTFLIGMALGFDSICFKLLEKIREKENIKIIACVPCPEQAEKYTDFQYLEYKRMLNSADEVLTISKKYSSFCMKKRNQFIIDNSSVLVSYVRREKSGSGQTKRYATKNNLIIITI